MSEHALADLPDALKLDYEAGRLNGCVGTTLLSETDKVRVWNLRIPARGRFGFHRHVLNYFWTALNAGRTRNYFEDAASSMPKSSKDRPSTRVLRAASSWCTRSKI